MIKFLELVKARPDISVERFHFYWRVVHTPLVCKISRLLGYIQNHRIDDGVWGFKPSGYQGILEIWFPHSGPIQDIKLDDPEYLDHAYPDEANFLDFPNCALDLSNDHILKGDSKRTEPSVRVFLIIRRKSDVEEKDFVSHLLGQAAEQIVAAVPSATRITMTLPDRGAPFKHGEYYDACLAFSFSHVAIADAARDCYPALAEALGDVVDLDATTSMLTEEVIGRAFAG